MYYLLIKNLAWELWKINMNKLIAASILIGIAFSSHGSQDVHSFSTAKKKLYTKVFPNSGKTFYCGCDWSAKKTDLNSCNLQSYFPKKQRKRSARTEAEHIIPASWMLKHSGKYRQCALDAKRKGESARDYCQKYDINYKKAHNDLVNLFPVVGQINADRSNKPFTDKAKTNVKLYGQCEISIGSRGIVPPKDKQGDIARIALYIQDTYGVTYSNRQASLFAKWNKQDPISAEERNLQKKIIQIQGYGMTLK